MMWCIISVAITSPFDIPYIILCMISKYLDISDSKLSLFLTRGSTFVTCLSARVVGIKLVVIGGTSARTFHGHIDKLDVTIFVIPRLVSVVTSEIRTIVVVVWQKLTIVFTSCETQCTVWLDVSKSLKCLLMEFAGLNTVIFELMHFLLIYALIILACLQI